MTYKLRPYQEECVKSISDYINSDRHDPVLIVGPVGCGKSLLIAEAARLMGDKTLTTIKRIAATEPRQDNVVWHTGYHLLRFLWQERAI